jgi:hypothetical protein
VEIAFLGMPCQPHYFICTTKRHRSVSTSIILVLQCDPLVWEVEGWSTAWRRPREAEVDDGEYCPSKKQKFHCLKYTPSVPT